jgi:hypothetical protein
MALGLPWGLGLILACGAAFGPAGVARGEAPEGEDGDRETLSEEDAGGRNYFSLDRLDGYVELESVFDRSRVKGGRWGGTWRGWGRPQGQGDTQINQDLGLRERVGLQFEGSAIDPGIIQYIGDASFALTQNRFKERDRFTSRTDDDDGYLLEYDLRANLLTGRIISGSVYGLRQQDRVSRRFQPTLDEERTGYGTSWYFAHDRFPMELTYDYLETDRTGNRDQFDDEHFTESTLHYGAQWIISDDHHLKFDYEHAQTKQKYQGLGVPFETTRDLFTIEHELAFGGQGQHSFRTLVHWQEESGDFARDFFEIGPQVTLQHTEDLQTLYKYQFNRERYEGLDVETHRADWQLVHQMYRNLTTTVDIFGLYEDVDQDVDTTQYGGSVDWQYNRKNPYGRLYANLALAYDSEHLEGRDGPRVVLNESARLVDPLPFILRNRNVEITSILVTDASGRRIYLAGVDYLVLQTRDVTRLTRVLTGRIADGDTVLIDYRYQVPGRGRLDTMRVDLGIEQRFSGLEGAGAWVNGLTPYYRLAYRNQEDDYSSRSVSWTADRTDHHRIGLRYERDKYTLGGEFEVFDDTIEPYHAFHMDGLWHIVATATHTVDASSRFSRFFFEGGLDERKVNMLDLELDHRWFLGESVSTFERLTYRWEDDSVDGMTHAWDATAGLEATVGDLTAQVSVEYDRLDLPDSTEDDVGVWLRIRRNLPNLLN